MSLSSLADKVCPPVCRPLLNRVQSSPIGKRLASGTFWSVVGIGIGKGLTFVAMVLVARILGTQLYGELGLIRSITNIFFVLSSFGIGTTVTTYIAESLLSDKKRVGRVIALCYLFTFFTCFIISIVFYFLAPWLCVSTLNAPHLIDELRASTLLLIFTTFMGVQIGVISGFQDFRCLALVNFVAGLISVPLFVGGAWYGGLTGSIVGVSLAALANVVVNSCFIYQNTNKNNVHYSFRDAWKEIPILWQLSLPTFLCGITLCIFTTIYQTMLAAQPNGFHELGLYTAATQIEMIMYFIPVQIGSVALPLLSELRGKGDVKKTRLVSNLATGLNMGITFLFVLPVCFLSRQIMKLFGDGFADGTTVLMALCCGIVFHAGIRTLYVDCISQNKMWHFFIVTMMFQITQLVLLYYFLKVGYGAFGMAAAYSVAHALYFFGVIVIKNHTGGIK